MAIDASAQVMALDVGLARIGVATTTLTARLPAPLATIANDNQVLERIQALCHTHHVQTLVVGLPRNMAGDTTVQTQIVKDFVALLQKNLSAPIVFQDESLTSVRAKEELIRRGQSYTKADIDALAATYILEDYVNEHV